MNKQHYSECLGIRRISRPSPHLWLLLIISLASVPNLAASAECPPLPPRTALLDEKLPSLLLESTLKLQGKAKYDPNPPRSINLSALVKQLDPAISVLLSQTNGEAPQRSITYYLNSMDTQEYGLIPVPKEQFWCLLRRGSTLLLSDGTTLHYTALYQIDRDHDTVDFIDTWPDDIFLREGFNARDVAAKIVLLTSGGKLVRITRQELERVIVGATSVELLNFLSHILKVVPSGRTDPRLMLSIAINTLGEPSAEAPLKAIPYYSTAFESAMATSDSGIQETVAKEALYAALLSSYWIQRESLKEGPKKQAVKDINNLTQRVIAKFPSLSSKNVFKERQLKRLGQLAWQMNQPHDAEAFFNTLIQKTPDNPEGYFGRAKARNKLLDHEGTIMDSTKAIGLLAERLNQKSTSWGLNKGASAYEMADFVASTPERKETSFMLRESYFLRGNVHNARSEFRNAELDGRSVIDLEPTDPQGYIIVATSLYGRTRYFEAIQFYDAAIRQLPNGQLQSALRNMKKETERKAAGNRPEWRLGTLDYKPAPFGFVFRNSVGLKEFIDKSTAGQKPDAYAHTWSCMVPNGSPVCSLANEEEGTVSVEADMSIVGGSWSPVTPDAVKLDYICRGVVPDFYYKPAPK